MPMYYIPGNHDIPIGGNPSFSPHARERYEKHFNLPNTVLEVANHSLILLDSVGLVEEDYRRYADEMQYGDWEAVPGGVIEFVKDLGDCTLRLSPYSFCQNHVLNPVLPEEPRILFSHIPLARPEGASCGPLREHGRISKGAGPGYQNLLGSETSRFLLDELNPSIIFSGDDHDYCDVKHARGVREVTIKSFTTSGGIRRPGFQLLSLVSPSPDTPYTSQTTIADRPCFLPDQAGVYYRVYLPLAILTLIYLIGTRLHAAWVRLHMSGSTQMLNGDLKARASPAMTNGEFSQLPTGRRTSDRALQLSLPPRTKSSGALSNLSIMTPSAATSTASGSAYQRPHRINSGSFSTSTSAPGSPIMSPRMRAADYDEKDDDIESVIETPSLSRRSSYIYMHAGDHGHNSKGYGGGGGGHPGFNTDSGAGTNGHVNNAHFLPLPTVQGRTGLGLSAPSGSLTPNSAIGRTASSSNLASPMPLSPAGGGRILPRVLSASDWSSAAKAKDKSVLGVMMDSLPLPSSARRGSQGGQGRGLDALRTFVRALWKARNSLVGRSWREAVAVAWPPALVWLLVNALFFME